MSKDIQPHVLELGVFTSFFGTTALFSRILTQELSTNLIGNTAGRVVFEHGLEAAAFILICKSILDIKVINDPDLVNYKSGMLTMLLVSYGILQFANETWQSISAGRPLQIEQLIGSLVGIGMGLVVIGVTSTLRDKIFNSQGSRSNFIN